MWSVLFDKGILTTAIVLCIIGSTIKYRTGTNNELICLVLTILSFAFWSIAGLVMGGSNGIISILWSYGIKRGLLSAGLSVFCWDLLHGTKKGLKKTSKEGENNAKDVT